MNLSSPFINRPVMTTLIMVAILLFGLFAYKSLPVSDLPNVDYPTITVTAEQPGGSPEYMANLVATPLERNLATIPGIHVMSSNNTLGKTQIVLNFNPGVDINSKEVEVQAAITQSMPNIPPLPSPPIFEKQNPSDSPVMYVALTSNCLTLASLYDIGYNVLAQPISMIEGIAQVLVYGYPYAVRVQADPMKLMAHKIDLNQLANALQMHNPNFPSGTIQGRYSDAIIDTFGMLTTGAGCDEVMISQNQCNPLYVSNVASGQSALDQREPYFRYITRHSDECTVVLAVSRLPGSNSLNISKAVFDKLPFLKKSIPPTVNLSIFYNQADPIIESVKDVQYTLALALVLVVIVIFLYLGKIRETLIPGITLPASIVATFAFMYLAGFSLDILSLLALTLSIGFIVDDAIVVLENIVRHKETGKTAYASAMEGSSQISITVLTMTFALSAVFIPFIWMPGILGKLFHEFSLTIIIAILCSGFISLTLIPMLCSRFLSRPSSSRANFSSKLHSKLVRGYAYFLHKSFRYKPIILMTGIACLLLTLGLLKILPFDFLPKSNSDLIEGLVMYNQGSSKQNSIAHQKQLNHLIAQNPYQKCLISIAGYPTNDQGVFYVRLVDKKDRPSATRIAEDLYKELNKIPGVSAFVKPYPLVNLQVGNATSLGEYQYTLSCLDQVTLFRVAEAFVHKLKEIPGITGVNSDLRVKTPQLSVSIDRDRVGVYGLTAGDIESTLQYAYSGGRISTFSKGVNLYDLIVEVDPGYNTTKEDLDLLYIKSFATGELVPMSSVASWKEVAAASSINHINTFPSVTISFNLARGIALSNVLKKIDRLAETTLPEHVLGTIQGSGDVFVQTFTAMGWLFIVAIAVIYILLGILYESFIHPLTILSALPAASLGGLLTIWMVGMPLSLFSVVGLIVLIGLVQKNGIMMIDFALDYLKKTNATPQKAIVEACKARFRPILMTTLAAMMGALPIVVGSEMNRPLGLVVFGGLLFSQLITLFVTPIVFLYMQDLQNFFKKRNA